MCDRESRLTSDEQVVEVVRVVRGRDAINTHRVAVCPRLTIGGVQLALRVRAWQL